MRNEIDSLREDKTGPRKEGTERRKVETPPCSTKIILSR